MVVEFIEARLSYGIVNILMGLMLMYFSFKNWRDSDRSFFERRIGYSLSLTGLSFILVVISMIANENFVYFLSRICLTFSAIIIFDMVSNYGFVWTRKYFAIPVLSLIAIYLSYNDAFVYGGVDWSQSLIFYRIPTFLFIGIGLIITGLFLRIALIEVRNNLYKDVIPYGFILQGIINIFLGPIMVSNDMINLFRFMLTAINILLIIAYFRLVRLDSKLYPFRIKTIFKP